MSKYSELTPEQRDVINARRRALRAADPEAYRKRERLRNTDPMKIKRRRELAKIRRRKNRDKYNALCQKWYAANRETALVKMREYRAKHRVRLNAQSVAYTLNRRKTDPSYRALSNVRRRIHHLIDRTIHGVRSFSCSRSVGCTQEQFKACIEATFKPGMSWENYGTHWVVDHIRPLASFNLLNLEEAQAANHYTNLQALTIEDNRLKADTWNPKVDSPDSLDECSKQVGEPG